MGKIALFVGLLITSLTASAVDKSSLSRLNGKSGDFVLKNGGRVSSGECRVLIQEGLLILETSTEYSATVIDLKRLKKQLPGLRGDFRTGSDGSGSSSDSCGMTGGLSMFRETLTIGQDSFTLKQEFLCWLEPVEIIRTCKNMK